MYYSSKVKVIQLLVLLYINGCFGKVVTTYEKFPCKTVDKNNICVCEKSCLRNYNYENKTYCIVDSCWKYKDDECLPNGKNYVAPLILNAIPVTSVIGIGYGMLERWDLFVMQISILVGPIILFCCFGCIHACCCKKDDILNENDDNSDACCLCCANLYPCCYGILLLIFWILSIIWVATPEMIKDGNGCYLSGY